MPFAAANFLHESCCKLLRVAEMTAKSPDEALHQGEEIYRLIIESAREYAIFTTDLEGRVVTWNAGAERIFGYDEAEILGQDARAIFTPEDQERNVPEQEMRTALDTGRGEDRRWHLRKGGTRFWADGFMMPLMDEDDRARGFVKVVRDRTAEKEAEERYKESEERLRLMFESASEYAIFTVDPENRVTTWNVGAELLLGYSEEDILGQDARIFFTPEDRERRKPEEELAKALAEGRAENERWHVRKDGSRFWASGLMMPLKDDPRGPRGFVNIFRDMTEQRHLSAKAEAERKRLAEVFQRSPSFMAVLRGPEHVFELVNERYYQLVGHRELAREAGPRGPAGSRRARASSSCSTASTRPASRSSARTCGVMLQREPGQPAGRAVRRLRLPADPRPGRPGLGHPRPRHRPDRAEAGRGAAPAERGAVPDPLHVHRRGLLRHRGALRRRRPPVDYRFLEVNPAFEKHTGLRDATGKRIRELAPDHEAHWFETYGRVAETGEPVRFENEAKALGGRWFDVYAFRLGEPEQRRVAVLFTDITERKRLERTLRHRVGDLAEADRRKDEFLAMLAHELRNPLAAIGNAVRLSARSRPGGADRVGDGGHRAADEAPRRG